MQHSGRVLLAEDHPVNQDMMREMLRITGLSVVAVDNGEQTVAVLEWIPDQPEADVAFSFDSVDQAGIDGVKSSSDDADSVRVDVLRGVEDLSTLLPIIQGRISSNQVEVSDAPATSEGLNSAHDVLDQKVLGGVLNMCTQASPGLFEQIVQTYIDNSINDVQLLRNALEELDMSTLGSRAHRLKSSSANLGGMQLARICQLLESAAKSDHEYQLAILVSRISEEHGHVVEALAFERERAA